MGIEAREFTITLIKQSASVPWVVCNSQKDRSAAPCSIALCIRYSRPYTSMKEGPTRVSIVPAYGLHVAILALHF